MFQDGPGTQPHARKEPGEASLHFLALVERGQALAALLDAKRFAVVFAVARDGRTTLIPFIDTSFPGLSGLSRALTAISDQMRLAAAVNRAEPTVFAPNGVEGLENATIENEALVADETGILLPVHAPCGRRGLVAISGPDLKLDDEGLMRAHLRAFSFFRAASDLRAPEAPQRHGLSKRDIECLRLTADGMTSDQIAEALGLSVHTANQYVASAVAKLDAVNRMHAVAKALRAGIIS